VSLLRVTSLAIAPALLGATALLAGPPATSANAAAPVRAQAAGSTIPPPRPGLVRGTAAVTGPGSLSSVAALSAKYAWAVGSEQVGTTLRTLIAHWNGRASNAWAVGTISPPNSFLSSVLIEHWNGHSWRLDPAS
jgi:hypothetical protein